MLTLSCLYVGPILPLCWPYLGLRLPHHVPNYVKTPSTCHFFRAGAPLEPQNHAKRVVFARTKHRKTRCFWTPWAEYTVNYKGSGTGEVGRLGSAAGAACLYNLRLPSEGLRQGHGRCGRPLGPAPGLKGCRPCRRPLTEETCQRSPLLSCWNFKKTTETDMILRCKGMCWEQCSQMCEAEWTHAVKSFMRGQTTASEPSLRFSYNSQLTLMLLS